MALFIFLLALPVIYSWLSPLAILGDQNQLNFTRPSLFAIYLLAAMAIFVFIAVVYNFFFHEPKIGGKYWARAHFAKALGRALLPFSKQSETTSITQNIREEDPTKYEFDHHFREIVSEIQKNENRLIIVFDNVDRLPPDLIVKAWSEIRSVYVTSESHVKRLREAVTVIIPFDAKHVLEAHRPTDQNVTEGDIGLNDSAKRAAHSLESQDVFRKSFDAVFTVAPPVLSDAAAFFHEKIGIATKGFAGVEAARKIYRIFDLNLQDKGVPSTPRQLVDFINSVTALWVQRASTIPLEAIAVYVVHQEQIERNPANLRRPGLIGHRYEDQANCADLHRYLAALAYNVETSVAYQVLLDKEIERAFTEYDKKAIASLAESPGFDAMLHIVFEESSRRWAAESVTSFSHAVAGLTLIDISETVLRDSVRPLIEAISSLAPQARFRRETFDLVFKVVLLCRDYDVPGVFVGLTNWLRRSLPEGTDRDFKVGEKWASVVRTLLDVVDQRGDQSVEKLLTKIDVPEGTTFVLGAACASDLNDMTIKRMNLTLDHSAIAVQLETYVVQKPIEFFRIWGQIGSEIGEDVVDRLFRILADDLKGKPQGGSPKPLAYKLENLVILYADTTANRQERFSICESLVDDYALFKHAVEVEEEEGDSGTETAHVEGLVLFLVTLIHKDLQLPDKNLQNHPLGDLNEIKHWISRRESGSGNEAALDMFAAQIILTDTLSEYIQAASTRAHELLQRVVIRVVDRKEAVPTVDVLVAHFDFLVRLLSTEALKGLLTKCVDLWPKDNWKRLDVAALSPTFVGVLSAQKEEPWRNVLEGVDRWLRETDAEQWAVVFEREDPRLDLLRVRVARGGLTLAPSKFQRPLRDHFVEVLTGNVEPSGEFDVFLRALPSTTSESVKLEMLESLSGKQVSLEGLSRALTSYAHTLRELPLAQANRVAITRLLSPLISLDDHESSNIIRACEEDWRTVLSSAAGADVELINELLEGQMTSEQPEETRARAKMIAELLGLDFSNA
ncbi:ATP/GTP-binding protein [Salinisphaera dokdonensis CL-ES53]|uniref:ATP/GTP-binding protein n=2 Tax=Salinisphaera TaxID=180541 RepID=A0ABV2B3L0_9GAMM